LCLFDANGDGQCDHVGDQTVASMDCK